MRKHLLLLFCILAGFKSYSQTDTAFWFAAPDISSSFNYDRPIVFRISAYQSAASVTISQPANPSFTPITISLPAFTTQTVDLTPQIANIECGPGDVIQNHGLKIKSDNNIAAYYEVNVNGPNPELFALKGKNALGTQFYISSQNYLNNSNAYTVPPLSSFNIVASEDNTQVTINPTKNITGHAPNIPFTITLNRGQTYAAIAVSQAASQHLDGSSVTSSKPVAITLADDLLEGGTTYGGGCQDLAGDQTVPVNVLGTQYIAIQSNLNFPYDKLNVIATQNNTTITQDGVLVNTLSAGQSILLPVSNVTSYLQTSAPVYVYQLAGAGCEMGAAILPKIDCTGSSSVSVARSSNENLYITLLIRSGGQGSFLINNAAGVITAAQFNPVANTSNQWYYAKIFLPLASYPNGSVVKIDNTTALFQMGFLQGNTLGLSFGYFSDYNTITANATADNYTPCAGSTVTLHSSGIPSAVYSWTGPGGYTSSSVNPVLTGVTTAQSGTYTVNITVPGCGTYTGTVTLTVISQVTTTVNQSICDGQSYLGYTSTGTYVDHFTSVGGCDSARTLNLIVKPRSFTTINQTICDNQSYNGHSTAGTYTDTYAAANGCDSVVTLHLMVKPRSFTTNNQTICDGQTYQGHTTTGTYLTTLTAANGCDSVITLNLTVKPRSFTTNSQTICDGQTYQGHTVTGTYITTLTAANGCDSVVTLNLTVKPRSFTTINQAICDNQNYNGHTTAGTYTDTYIAANGCDSIVTLHLTVKPRSFTTINQTICDNQSYNGHSSTGTFTDNFVSANGCDSVVTLHLIVKPRSFTTNNQIICDGQTYQGHTTSGTYTTTLTAANGCDSVYTLNLTVKPRSFTTNNQSICEGQIYQGHNVSGTYISTFTAANGCDSIYTLNLTVNPKPFTTINKVICEGQAYQGYSTAGTYIDIFSSSFGCDSTRTLNLTVKPRSFTTINQTICSGNIYLGYSSSGTYVDTYTAANGCDSIRTLNLTVNPTPVIVEQKTICEGQLYQGHGTMGTYTNTYTSAGGCDSIHTLVLTVNPLPRPDLGNDTSICYQDKIIVTPGVFDSYLWQDGSHLNNYTITEPGQYTVTVTNNCGSATDKILVGDKSCEYYFPNVFTPNNDQNNDYFRILNYSGISDYSLTIFNRWGEKVFETNEISKGWDGNYKNHPAVAASYVWYSRFKKHGRLINISGNVILIR